MRPIRLKISRKIRPANGLAPLLHVAIRLALPLLVLILSLLSIGSWLPLLVVLLSKWRIFAVRPRFWPANLRANAVDIMVGVSVVLYMDAADSWLLRLIFAALYAGWLLIIKPRSTILAISAQAGIAQLAALLAVSIAWPEAPVLALVLINGAICYLAARHFFDSFNEPYAKLLATLWADFGAALTWVLSHLTIVYLRGEGPLSQLVILLSVIGYTLGAMYYLEHFDRLSSLARRELSYIAGGAIVVIVVALYYQSMNLIIG